MINPEHQIEQLLRGAPRPTPPSDLEAKLMAQIQLPPPGRDNSTSQNALAPRIHWLRRWWPALAPAALSAAFAVVVSVQVTEIQSLKKNIEALSQTAGVSPAANQTDPNRQLSVAPTTQSRPTQEQEIERLKQLVNKLRSEIGTLEQMRVENDKLRSQIASATGGLTAEETAALEQARDKAQSIQCVNNLKQLGLAVRLWAGDNGEKFPTDLLQMTNEMTTPKILHCPADTTRTEASNFAVFTAANCSYDYLAPGASEIDPYRVLWRCPIHGHIGLCDGSVQGEAAKKQSNLLVQREGKLYFQQPATMEIDPKSREAFERRYGLKPAIPADSNQKTNP